MSKNRSQQLRPYIAFSSALFFISIFFGYISSSYAPEEARMIVQELKQSFAFVENMNALELFLFIFLNNSLNALAALLFGVVFGLVPLLLVFSNGQVLGVVLYFAREEIGILKALAAILPHGIIEIPVILIATGHGMWLGVGFYKYLRHKKPFREKFIFSFKKYLKVIVPLLFLASLVETFVTPFVIELF